MRSRVLPAPRPHAGNSNRGHPQSERILGALSSRPCASCISREWALCYAKLRGMHQRHITQKPNNLKVEIVHHGIHCSIGAPMPTFKSLILLYEQNWECRHYGALYSQMVRKPTI